MSTFRQQSDQHGRARGILPYLRRILGGWIGPSQPPGDGGPARERIKSGPPGITLPWFLPYFDPNQSLYETESMRLAYRKMLADPNVKAALMGKILAVGALDLEMLPARRQGRKSRRHELVSDFAKWNLTESLTGGVPALVWSVLSGGLIDGYSINEKVWEYESGGEWSRKYTLRDIKPKDTGRDAVLETDEFRNVIGVRGLRYNPGQIFHPSDFLIYRHLPLWDTPTGMSDLRAAYSRYWLLDTVLKLRAIGLEKRSLPVLLGTYTHGNQRPSLEEALALVKSQNWLAVPEGVKVEALNIAGSADEQFGGAVKDLKHDIFLGIAGAILQALEGTITDGRGNSKVHRSTADLFIWWLARSIESLLNDRRHGLIRDVVDLNFAVDRYPRAVLGAVDIDELKAELEIDHRLWSMGVALSKEAIYEKYGRKPPQSKEDTLSGEKDQEGQSEAMPGLLEQDPDAAEDALGGVSDPPDGISPPVNMPGLDDFIEKFIEEKKDKLGRRICYDKNKRVKCPPKGESADPKSKKEPEAKQTAKKAKADSESVKKKIDELKSNGSVSADDAKALASELQSLTVAQLGQLKKDLGIKASGVKAELAAKIAEKALAAASSKSPVKPKPEPKPAKPKVKPKTLSESVKDFVAEGKDPTSGEGKELAKKLAKGGYIGLKGMYDLNGIEFPFAKTTKQLGEDVLQKLTKKKELEAKIKQQQTTGDLTPAEAKQLHNDLVDLCSESGLKALAHDHGIKPGDPTGSGYVDKSNLAKSLAKIPAPVVPPKPSPVATPSVPVATPGVEPVPASPISKTHEQIVPKESQPDLTAEERKSIKEYTSIAYKPLNDSLRGNGKPHTFYKKHHEDLQSAFGKTKPFPEPIIVNRGMQFEPNDLTDFIALCKQSQAEGGFLRMPGYNSFSTRHGFSGNVQVKFSAKQGLDVKPYSTHPSEDEMLINHNAAARVTRIEKDGDKYIVHMEHVLDGQEKKPKATEVKTAEYKPGPNPPVTNITNPAKQKAEVESLVRWYVAKQNLNFHNADQKEMAKQLSKYAPGISQYETSYALANLSAQHAKSLMSPMFSKGAKNGPTGELPGESRPSLTPDEQLACQKYTSSAFRAVNGALRNGDTVEPHVKQMHEGLKSAFSKAKPFAHPVEVKRGLNFTDPADKQAFLAQVHRAASEGGTLKMGGYASTSIGNISHFSGNVELRIKAIHGLDVRPYTHYPDEKELLLDHNSGYKVKSVNQEGGKHVIDLEQVPPNQVGPDSPETKLVVGTKESQQKKKKMLADLESWAKKDAASGTAPGYTGGAASGAGAPAPKKKSWLWPFS